MRLVVTGAGGGLGRAFLAQLPSHHDVHAFTHAELDVGDHHAVMGRIPPIGPDAIVNLAAFTSVDDNETDRPRAWRDNALGPQSLALAAAASGGVLLHVSTDYVFDGTKGSPYDEFDDPGPLSVYARSKLAGERLVREAWPRHVIVRTGHVFGGGGDYLTRALARLRVGEEAGGLTDRFGSPTFVRHLAERLLPVVLSGRVGTFHLGGPERTCWFDVLQRLRTIGSLPGTVVAQRSDELGLPAPRPVDSSLTSVLVAALDVPPMPPLDEALRTFLEEPSTA